MPTISMFFGIVIYMYFFDDTPHKQPHIHARYQGAEAAFSLPDGEILAGSLPTGKTRMVQAWIEIHHEALLADWELVVNGERPFPIDPLR